MQTQSTFLSELSDATILANAGNALPLLIELLTEELPPKSLELMANHFANHIHTQLKTLGFLADFAMQIICTPRRIGVLFANVYDQTPSIKVEEKLMPANIGYQNELPTPALLKKMQALNIDETQLTSKQDATGKFILYANYTKSGLQLQNSIQTILDKTIKDLPIAKRMTYQRMIDGQLQNLEFVRPAHHLIGMHGQSVLPVNLLGLQAASQTLGHRFLSDGLINIQPQTYFEQLKQAYVIADINQRKALILEQLQTKALQENLSIVNLVDENYESVEALIDEVAALVEWPIVYLCQFDKAFLQVPQECLILTMQTNQKYFPLYDTNGQLSHQFLVVSPMQGKTMAEQQILTKHITDGNQRVISPRLSDAKFFYEEDLKQPLLAQHEKLKSIIYHNQLGSQYERTLRIEAIAKYLNIQLQLNIDETSIHTASCLIKADLISQMVGEFPELQGTMGRYYALAQGFSLDIANSIEAHYWSNSKQKPAPGQPLSQLIALSDKLETLLGIWSIGLIPTGDKDPYALKRHALDAMLLFKAIQQHQAHTASTSALRINLNQLIKQSNELAGFNNLDAALLNIESLMLDRYQMYQIQQHGYTTLHQAIFSTFYKKGELALVKTEQIAAQILQRYPTLEAFVNEHQSLIACYKRIFNILKKQDAHAVNLNLTMNESLFEPAELALWQAYQNNSAIIMQSIAQEDYLNALQTMNLAFAQTLAKFFEEIMVITDDMAKRAQRLAMLAQIKQLLQQVIDLEILT